MGGSFALCWTHSAGAARPRRGHAHDEGRARPDGRALAALARPAAQDRPISHTVDHGRLRLLPHVRLPALRSPLVRMTGGAPRSGAATRTTAAARACGAGS